MGIFCVNSFWLDLPIKLLAIIKLKYCSKWAQSINHYNIMYRYIFFLNYHLIFNSKYFLIVLNLWIDCKISSTWMWFRLNIYIYTIVDLFCENGFMKAIHIVHWKQNLRCNEKSTLSWIYQLIVCLSLIKDSSDWCQYSRNMQIIDNK